MSNIKTRQEKTIKKIHNLKTQKIFLNIKGDIMKNIKEKQKLIIMSMVTTAVIVISLFSTNNDQTLKTSVNVGSTKTIGWGIKRAKNNMQPDVGTDNRKMLEENSGICLGNDMEKVIYLTFDEGYEAGYTENILNTLKKNDVKATFFITSHSVFLKYSSPHLSKISLIVIPSCSTIISSVSTRLYFEISEIALLISVLPVSILAVINILIFRKPPF